jgi:hypothetical protein
MLAAFAIPGWLGWSVVAFLVGLSVTGLDAPRPIGAPTLHRVPTSRLPVISAEPLGLPIAHALPDGQDFFALVALVDLAGKLPTTAASISSSASAVAVSASARHDVQAQGQAVQQVYRDASCVTVAGLALTLPFLAWFSQPLALAWPSMRSIKRSKGKSSR